MISGWSDRSRSTLAGFLAILCWSSSVAVVRSLSGSLGLVSAGMWVYLLSALVAFAWFLRVPGALHAYTHMRPRYLLVCGGLFVACMVCLYAALGLSHSDLEAIEAGIINYLWPGLTILLSIPLLRTRARPTVGLGIAMALCGVVLAKLDPNDLSLARLLHDFVANPFPYILALGAAVTWALYSNFARLWAEDVQVNPVPVFMLLTAGAFLLALPFVSTPAHWTGRSALELLYMALIPTFAGYALWDRAMHRGRMMLVVAASYLTPLLSTFISTLYLRQPVSPTLWMGCALVVGGSVVCKLSVGEAPGGKIGSETAPVDRSGVAAGSA